MYNRVDFGLFLFHKFFSFTPPTPQYNISSPEGAESPRRKPLSRPAPPLRSFKNTPMMALSEVPKRSRARFSRAVLREDMKREHLNSSEDDAEEFDIKRERTLTRKRKQRRINEPSSSSPINLPTLYTGTEDPVGDDPSPTPSPTAPRQVPNFPVAKPPQSTVVPGDVFPLRSSEDALQTALTKLSAPFVKQSVNQAVVVKTQAVNSDASKLTYINNLMKEVANGASAKQTDINGVQRPTVSSDAIQQSVNITPHVSQTMRCALVGVPPTDASTTPAAQPVYSIVQTSMSNASTASDGLLLKMKEDEKKRVDEAIRSYKEEINEKKKARRAEEDKVRNLEESQVEESQRLETHMRYEEEMRRKMNELKTQHNKATKKLKDCLRLKEEEMRKKEAQMRYEEEMRKQEQIEQHNKAINKFEDILRRKGEEVKKREEALKVKEESFMKGKIMKERLEEEMKRETKRREDEKAEKKNEDEKRDSGGLEVPLSVKPKWVRETAEVCY